MGYSFQQITGQTKFRAWKTWKKHEFAVIKVESFSPNKKNAKYHDINGKLIEHNFQQSDWQPEDRVTLNGTTGTEKFLNSCLENLGEDELKSLVGRTVKVVYMGMETVKTGEWAGSQTHTTECYLATEEGKAAPSEDVVAEAKALVAKSKSIL